MTKKKSNKASLILSIDTELLWGYTAFPFDYRVSLMKNDSSCGRNNIEFLLNLFEKYSIPATWAVVGHLFLERCENGGGGPHKDMPRYKKNWYQYDPCSSIVDSPLYYGKDIIENILSSKIEHEIGYHSFSHVDFSCCSKVVAEAEIKKGIELAKLYNVILRSFTFPNNKIGHIDVLKKFDFLVYRGDTLLRGKKRQNFIFRNLNASLDKIIAPSTQAIWKNGIWEIPASMCFADPTFKSSVLLKAKLGAMRAIKSNGIFHIYFHPHDLLLYHSLKNDLEKFLMFISKKQDENKITVLPMGGFITGN